MNESESIVHSSELLAVLRSRIDGCKKEESRLEKLLLEKRRERKEIQLDAVNVEFGITVGSVVIGRNGQEYRVTSISESYSRPWLKGNPRKKDGTWGTAERNLFGDWKVSPANATHDGRRARRAVDGIVGQGDHDEN